MNHLSTLLLALALLLSAATGSAASLLQPGDTFPAWTLTDHRGRAVSSKDLEGKTYVLWFYPKAMTPGCTAEGQGFRDRSAAFRAAGVEIFGVSFDEPEANDRFVEAEGFPFRLLSDSGHSLALRVGAARTSDQSVPSRISYLVGADGKVLRSYDNVDPRQHPEEVLRDATAGR